MHPSSWLANRPSNTLSADLTGTPNEGNVGSSPGNDGLTPSATHHAGGRGGDKELHEASQSTPPGTNPRELDMQGRDNELNPTSKSTTGKIPGGSGGGKAISKDNSRDWRYDIGIPRNKLPPKLDRIPEGIEEHHSIMSCILI
jgi:hypothetical protein